MLSDLFTAVIGPAGIVLGWWLNQRTTQDAEARQADRADSAAERERVLRTAALAREAAGQMRTVLHGFYRQQVDQQKLVGFDDYVLRSGTTKEEFRDSVLALRVLGPSWAVGGAERIDVSLNKLVELGHLMQTATRPEHLDSAGAELPRLDEMVRDYIHTASSYYNGRVDDLPPQPDLEKVGRWEPPGPEA
ncbi:hypothetical protein [Janibacter melonis]|uniref:hypothetical protein n=1 Tax=Janibacter melonis TaxID=262209 RepID=UPI0017482CBE|nr:hypothetical protein [Janibacter melonis]